MMNKQAQVGIIVAILVVTLLASVLITIQVYYIPKWMKEREAEHMDVVANQFANLKYSLDLLAAERTSSPLTNTITLGSKELPYFVSSRAFGSLQILSATTSNFSLSLGGDALQAIYYGYNSSSVSGITNVLSVKSLEAVITDFNNGDTFNVSFWVKVDNTTENVSIVSIGIWQRSDLGNTFQINLTITNRSNTVFNQPIAIGIQDGGIYRINLLSEDFGLTSILSSLPTPFNISFVTSSSNAYFLINCYKYEDVSILPSFSFGTIKYDADNAYFVDQSYIYEGGAVILTQITGDTMLYPPLLEASNSSGIFNLTLVNVIAMPGKGAAAGYGTYAIRCNFSSWQTYRWYAQNFSLNITTNYANAWSAYLQNEMEKSGIDYTIESGNNYVKLTLREVHVIIGIATIYAQIGPGWVT